MKNKKLTVIIIIAVVLVLLISSVVGAYNGLVALQGEVDMSYSNIQTQLQRRMDLIPNLVNTVKGYAAHESEVIKSISDARAKLAGAGNAVQAAQADAELSAALSRLLVVVENYPNLKADRTFISLMDELSGTENRISVARKDYNETAKNFNVTIRKFPKNIIANLMGFKAYSYYEASEGAENAPNVSFD